MSKQSHTPGPFHNDGPRYQSKGAKVYKQWGNAGNQQLVADCSAHDENSPECVANATLFAAAPDLLAACEAMLENADKVLAGLPVNHEAAQFIIGLRIQARAAIAKAVGA